MRSSKPSYYDAKKDYSRVRSVPRDDYWTMRGKVVSTEHENGVHPDYLARMVACITEKVPDIGEGSELDKRNKAADAAAEARLAALRTPSVPAVPFMTRAAPFMARLMTVMALLSSVMVTAGIWHHSTAIMIVGGADVLLGLNSARIFRNIARGEGKT